jgi:hypothetical protein
MSAESVWNFIQWVHYLALSLWIGGIAFLSGIAAPAAFRSMASRTVAGEIVGKMLKQLNHLELICVMILLVTCFSAFQFVIDHKNKIWLLISILIFMGMITSFYSFHLSPQMQSLKEGTPTFDSLSKDNPIRAEFNRMHRLYVMLMGLNLLLGAGVLYGSVVVFKS